MSTTVIVLAVVAVIAIYFISVYNRLVGLRNNRENAFSNISVQLKQRYDMIPQLVATVKGYADHEKELLQKVTEARAAAMGANTINDTIAADNQLSSALAGLRVSLEAYPDLKANEQFSMLQAQLEGTENRINEGRKLYNEQVRTYNIMVRSFPMNLLAGFFGFQQKQGFAASEGAQNAPTVQF